ncbi:MAG: hypothetical protein CVU43_11850 [Chloroflexi bacterium HGW-Chloroflexi-5]|jgi:hypothetical protein|nr:MAG: hypothetical protein CVU43_11850 [Chloroflexi bacterium HGW-Chloroflexi-5]
MHLAYFDENKFTDTEPYFLIGGIIFPDTKALEFESILTQIQHNTFGSTTLSKDNEFHAKDIFHGKGNFKKKKIAERIKIFQDISLFITSNRIPIRLVCIDVKKHQDKYRYPSPEYRLGLMLILERFCDYLDCVDDLGIVFGDYEKDEITKSVLDFSQFKIHGSTPMYFGRPLGRLVDTVYFTHSHHSRFLQVSDMIIFMANRYATGCKDLKKWHEQKVCEAWDNIKANTDFKIQYWP